MLDENYRQESRNGRGDCKTTQATGCISLEEVVSNVIAAGKFLGWRASEHSQTSQDKVDYHKYPSGKEVMKAINGNDVIYTDKKGKLIEIKKKSDLKRVHAVTITFRHQKIDKTVNKSDCLR